MRWILFFLFAVWNRLFSATAADVTLGTEAFLSLVPAKGCHCFSLSSILHMYTRKHPLLIPRVSGCWPHRNPIGPSKILKAFMAFIVAHRDCTQGPDPDLGICRAALYPLSDSWMFFEDIHFGSTVAYPDQCIRWHAGLKLRWSRGGSRNFW